MQILALLFPAWFERWMPPEDDKRIALGHEGEGVDLQVGLLRRCLRACSFFFAVSKPCSAARACAFLLPLRLLQRLSS